MTTRDLEADNARLRELLRQAEGQLDYHGDRSDLGARIAQAIAAISPPSASEPDPVEAMRAKCESLKLPLAKNDFERGRNCGLELTIAALSPPSASKQSAPDILSGWREGEDERREFWK